MTFTEEISEVFARYYDATPHRPRHYCRLCGELAEFSVEMDAQGERIFTMEEWEADAEAECADMEAAKALDRR
jgi:hypothetical protein